MKKTRMMLILTITFICLVSCGQMVKAKEQEPFPHAAGTPPDATAVKMPVCDLEAKMPVCTRRAITGGTAFFLIGARVCNLGTVDFVSPLQRRPTLGSLLNTAPCRGYME